MNGGYTEDNSCCYIHPKEVVIGVCALCLNERLLIFAAKQSSSPASATPQQISPKKPPINLPKIFAFGSLLTRLEFRHSKLTDDDDDDRNSDDKSHVSSTSPEEEEEEDSFISIEIEENGVASWEMGHTVSKISAERQSWNNPNHINNEAKQDSIKDMSREATSVIEHAKPRAALRWRKPIGQLFQVIKLKRSNMPRLYQN